LAAEAALRVEIEQVTSPQDAVATAQDGEQNQRADDGNDNRAKTAEAVREESEHRLVSSGDTPSVCIIERWMPSRLNFSTACQGASFDPVG